MFWKTIGKILFWRLFNLTMWLGAKAFSDGTVKAAYEHGSLSRHWVWFNIYRPREVKALASPGKADDTAFAFADGFTRFDQDKREQEAKDRETRGNHPGV